MHSVHSDCADRPVASGTENYSEAEAEGGGGGRGGEEGGGEEPLIISSQAPLDCFFHVSDPQKEPRQISSASGSSI